MQTQYVGNVQRLIGRALQLAVLAISINFLLPQPKSARSENKPDSDQLASVSGRQEILEKDVTQGALRLLQPDGTLVECPLRHTDIQADISGFIGRVKVTQTFHNPTREKIEAVYVFPLPHEAAVDEMTMKVGDRQIVGLIKRRAEARSIYEHALAAGQTAALLEQERPNIFTQSVGNIEPDKDVIVEISYVDVLRYDMGAYEFHFPMVVGPRYNPGSPVGEPNQTPAELQGKVSPPQPDTNRVPDASRISPPVMKPGVRNGHDVSLSIKLDAGVPIQNLKSTNHRALISHDKANQAEIKLAADDNIPNKDFVLRYDVVGEKPEMALLSHTGQYSGDAKSLGDGYFMLMIQPKEDERLKKSPPREVVFLVDVSGSMSGQPIAKAAECMREMSKICRPDKDTLQVLTFASGTNKLFEKPVPATNENVQKAVAASLAMHGGGGTEMLKGVKAAIDEPLDPQRVRIIIMLTDGYIGNEAEIIEHVGKHCGDQVRFWCVGIGQSPNMFLVDGVAKQGGGMGKKLGLNDDANSLAQEVMTRIQRAQLAKIKIDWGGLNVAETYPVKIPELWAGRPVMIYGRYRGGGDATIKVSGSVEGEAVNWPLKVSLPEKESQHDVLAKTWARQKIEDLMQQSFYGGSPAVEEMVTAIALDYKLMSQYTSFVAVDSKNAGEATEPAHRPRQMLVPVPLPEGTRWEGFFGGEGEMAEDKLADAFAIETRAKLDSAKLGAVRTYGRGRLPRGGGGGGGGFGGGGLGGGGGFGGRGGAIGDRLERAQRSSAGSRGAMPALMPAPAAAPMLQRWGQIDSPVSASAGVPVRGLSLQSNGRFENYGFAAGKASGPVAESLAKLRVEGLAELAEVEEVTKDLVTAAGATYQALQADVQANEKVAAEKLAAGKKAQEGGNLALARELFIQACLLDESAVNVGSGGTISAEAIPALQGIAAEQLKAWTKLNPELGKKLDLVIRDRSLEEAVGEVARAAGVNIAIIPGSIDDAKSLCNEAELRVNYLDLRRATLAEALDELLQPERLSWRLVNDKISVASDRRHSGNNAWVYDVSTIALPPGAELQKLNDPQKAAATAKEDADRLSQVVRTLLKSKAENLDVTWFSPGHLLVIATGENHAKVAKLLVDLTTANAKVEGIDGDVQKLYVERFAKREGPRKRYQSIQNLLETVDCLDFFGYKLLSSAAGGHLNDEALTELQIAWQKPQMAELLKGRGRPLALRALWMMSEASQALPEAGDLAKLVKTARNAASEAMRDSIDNLKKKPDDAEAFTAAMYAALASRADAEFIGKALPLLVASASKDESYAAVRTIAKALLADRQNIDKQAVTNLLTKSVSGEDSTLLLAMACRRCGDDVWNAFRSASPELVGNQPLNGEVVVLINRVGEGRLKIALSQ